MNFAGSVSSFDGGYPVADLTSGWPAILSSGLGLRVCHLVARHVVLEVNGPIREEMLANFGSPRAAALADQLLTFRRERRASLLLLRRASRGTWNGVPQAPIVRLSPTVLIPFQRVGLERRARLRRCCS